MSVVTYGCVHSTRDAELGAAPDLRRRVLELSAKLDEVFAQMGALPDLIAMEEFRWYGNHDGRSLTQTIKMGQVVGMLREKLRRLAPNATVEEYTPQELHAQLTGSEKSSKVQVQKMVQAVLHMDVLPKPQHAADALAAAITLALHMPVAGGAAAAH